jgi:hypothetical protein
VSWNPTLAHRTRKDGAPSGTVWFEKIKVKIKIKIKGKGKGSGQEGPLHTTSALILFLILRQLCHR